jgi:hypothetical protein
LGSLVGGAIAQNIGIRQTMLIGTGGYLLSTLRFTFSPVRRLRKMPAMPPGMGAWQA